MAPPAPPCAAVGPFSSPSETYQYYDLPFCQPYEKDNKLLTLGEVRRGGLREGRCETAAGRRRGSCRPLLSLRQPGLLTNPRCLLTTPAAALPAASPQVVDGNRMVATDYDLSFRVDRDKSVLCTLKLGQDDLAAFRKAILKDYYFQFFYDDLPIWGYVGKAEAIPGERGRRGAGRRGAGRGAGGGC